MRTVKNPADVRGGAVWTWKILFAILGTIDKAMSHRTGGEHGVRGYGAPDAQGQKATREVGTRMGRRWFILALATLVGIPGTAGAQGAPWPGGNRLVPDAPAYAGVIPGYHENGLGWSLGYANIYDSRPYPLGWYWPNVHWPSRDWHFTYRPFPDTYRVFYPSLSFPRGNSYYITVCTLAVHVPTYDADIWIDDVRMQQRGQDRVFVSPQLSPDTEYAYQITAQWTEDGKPYRQTQQVTVRRGEQTSVVFPVRR
jgi:uncharacterized protein (TIGR03000 family)